MQQLPSGSEMVSLMATEDFSALANQVTYNQPQIPLISNVTGNLADEEMATAQYWVNHVSGAVQFAQSMQTLHQLGYKVFIEIGSKPILLGLGRECQPAECMWLPSLLPGMDEWQVMLSSLGQLSVAGVKVDWSGFDRDYQRTKVVLPTYPFQRERYWIDTGTIQPQKQYLPKKLEIEQQAAKLSISTQNTKILQQLETAESSDRLTLLITYLQEQIGRILGFKGSQLPNIEQNFFEMGMDSLMLTELRNQIQTDLNSDIPINIFMEGATIVTLSNQINHQLVPINITQTVKPESNDQFQMNVKNSDWIEIEI
ncbi:acyl carrier protein [Trichormus variabilis]